MVDVRLKKPEYVVGKKVSISIMLLLGPGAIEVLTTLVMFASVGRVRPPDWADTRSGSGNTKQHNNNRAVNECEDRDVILDWL